MPSAEWVHPTQTSSPTASPRLCMPQVQRVKQMVPWVGRRHWGSGGWIIFLGAVTHHQHWGFMEIIGEVMGFSDNIQNEADGISWES